MEPVCLVEVTGALRMWKTKKGELPGVHQRGGRGVESFWERKRTGSHRVSSGNTQYMTNQSLMLPGGTLDKIRSNDGEVEEQDQADEC